jgi:hypothetical protein
MWLTAVAPAALALEVALLALADGRSRAFWIAFLATAALMGVSAVMALADPPKETTVITASSMVTTEYPGGPAARLWRGYHQFACACLGRLHYPYYDGTTAIPSVLTDGLLWAVPQWSVAVAVGLVARRGWSKVRRRASVID